MKKIVAFICVFCSFLVSANAQNIVGKWKPVSFAILDVLKGDLTKDKADITMSLDSLAKKDKDPEASKMMMEMIFQMLFDKLKTTAEEYTADGKYSEINTNAGKTKTGVYTINVAKQTLERKPSPNAPAEKFIYTVTDKKLVLKGKIGASKSNKTDLEIVYEKM